MNKKYMDFVPVDSKKTRTVKKKPAAVSVAKTDIKEVKARKITGGRVIKPVEKPVEKSNKVETKPPKPSIMELANNSDFSVETIAKEAKRIKERDEGEVFISLH